jgi:hypothetical protein
MTKPPAKRGPKPKDASGEVMAVRKIRMTDAQWADALFITPDRVRHLVTDDAKKKRKRGG